MPSRRSPEGTPLSRRELLTGIATGVVAAPLVRMLAACDDASAGATDTHVADADASDGDIDASDGETSDSGASDIGANDTTVVAWLSGGTAGMSGDYPDPFDAAGTSDARSTSTSGFWSATTRTSSRSSSSRRPSPRRSAARTSTTRAAASPTHTTTTTASYEAPRPSPTWSPGRSSPMAQCSPGSAW